MKKTIKEIIVDLLKSKVDLKKQEIDNMIEIPQDEKLGDFAFPCFILSKKEKKKPEKIAEEISLKLNKKIKKLKEIEKVEAVNSYINFLANLKEFTDLTFKKIDKVEKQGKKKNKIVIDFSSPNIGKPLHVGHVRSTILGDSIKKIHAFFNNKVIGINYLGDTGLHIGKLIHAYKLWGDDKKIRKNPGKELLSLYVKFCKKEKVRTDKEVKKNPGQEDKEEYISNEWTEKAKEELKKLERGDKENKKIWEKLKKYSLNSFEKVYKILGIEFDEITGQSKFSKKGKKVVNKALKKKIAQKRGGGEVAVKLEKDNLPDKVILRKDKTALYSTQDLGSAVKRYEKYKFDKMIYVVGSEQELYFKQIFKILEKLGYKWSDNLIHLPFGLISIEGGKISSREGKVVFLEEVLNKAKQEALKQIKKKNPKLKNKKKTAEKLGISALKYSTLSKEPIKNIKFSFKEALNFEGESGPYLQYSYVRASSILKKTRKKGKYEKGKIIEFDKEEVKLIKKLDLFLETVKKAKQKLNPSLIANYAFELASLFNEFYHSCQVIGSEKQAFRLKLVESFKKIMKLSLQLLGIEPVEEM